jgi:hypothetical protein
MPRHRRILTGLVHRAAAVNLARLTSLGPHGTPTGWAIT